MTDHLTEAQRLDVTQFRGALISPHTGQAILAFDGLHLEMPVDTARTLSVSLHELITLQEAGGAKP